MGRLKIQGEDKMGKEKTKIFVVGDGVAPTGFARVLNSILARLDKLDKWEIHHLAVNYRGDPHPYSWRIYPAALAGNPMADIYGLNRIMDLLDYIQPKLVFMLNDVWVLPMYMERIQEWHDRYKIVCYSPIDAGPIDWRWTHSLRDVDRYVVYTEFAKKVLEDSVEQWGLHSQDPIKFPKINVIPHGIDTKVFYKLDDLQDRHGNSILTGRVNAKRQVYPNRNDFLDSFVVLNANRNQPRKRIDLTMKGFSLFSKDKPINVKLYLHMGIEDMGWNIVSLADRYHIDDRLIISNKENFLPSVPDDRLNLIYNACDVGLNTSFGEGWGLTNFEHAATGAAQVITGYAGGAEVFGDSAVLMKPEFFQTTEKVLTEGAVLTPDQVADSLQKLYDNPAYLAEMSEKSYQVTQRPEFSWDSVANEFDKVFTEVLNE